VARSPAMVSSSAMRRGSASALAINSNCRLVSRTLGAVDTV
jgi:hypothetical protein